LAGNTKDSSTLGEFLDKIEKQYGKAEGLGQDWGQALVSCKLDQH
jgi:hypothetical protein